MHHTRRVVPSSTRAPNDKNDLLLYQIDYNRYLSRKFIVHHYRLVDRRITAVKILTNQRQGQIEQPFLPTNRGQSRSESSKLGRMSNESINVINVNTSQVVKH